MKDLSKNEQLSIVVHYVKHNSNMKPVIVEYFLKYDVAFNLTAEH